ncbi:hypothetical protein [Chlorogloea sp. CCALA 695]|nr:hypothetical protein [Chlorogloea sp. CCALA 695]
MSCHDLNSLTGVGCGTSGDRVSPQSLCDRYLFKLEIKDKKLFGKRRQ